jgi:sulfite exporter TauE/SafE
LIEKIGLLGFLTLGLLGGFGHCVGMCSPFVLFVSRRYAAPDAAPGERPADLRGAAMRAQLWYTAGRVTTYVALGALAGALGGVVQLAGALLGLQRAASVLAGALLVLWALAALSDLVPGFSAGGKLFGRLARAFHGNAPGHPFATGLFLGLLPCGLLYSAVLAAVARGGTLDGALALALFGLGTAPALLGLSLADELLARRRAFVNRLSQVFLLAMGAWFLWTGLAG